MLTQTKRAVDGLLASGLNRSEFTAHCERIMNGSTFVGYGDVHVHLRAPLDRCIELAPELAKTFTVIQYVVDGKVRHVSVEEANGHPRLVNRDISKKEGE